MWSHGLNVCQLLGRQSTYNPLLYLSGSRNFILYTHFYAQIDENAIGTIY